jgi:hypothetical protein
MKSSNWATWVQHVWIIWNLPGNHVNHEKGQDPLGNRRTSIFWKDEDYTAFEHILPEGLEQFDVAVYFFQLMPNQAPGGDLPKSYVGRFHRCSDSNSRKRPNIHCSELIPI